MSENRVIAADLPIAVEAKPSQVKKLGFQSNLYIVPGETNAFRYIYGLTPTAGKRSILCQLASRGARRPVALLEETEYSTATLEPRANRR